MNTPSLSSRRLSGAHLLLLGILMLLGTSLYSLWAGYSLVGKTFSGFSMEFSFITFPVDSQEWTGSKADFQYYEQIQTVDGQSFQDIGAFKRYIQSLAPGTPVSYTVIRKGKTVTLTIPTMIFSSKDYLKIFVVNIVLSWFYAALTLFILFRRRSINESRVLLFLTFSFTAVYALRAPYDYLHQFLPLALIAFSALPLALFLLGTHLVKSNRPGWIMNGFEKLNILAGCSLALLLGFFAVYLADAPYTHRDAFKLFVSVYEYLVAYNLVNIPLFMVLVLWRSVRRKSDELKSWQAKIILFGSLFSFLPYLVMMAAFWVFKLPWSLPSELVTATTYLFILFVFYAVLHDEGVALEAFIKNTAFYYILLFIFGLAYTIVFRLATVSMQASFISLSQDQIPFIAGLAAFMLVSIFNTRLQGFIARIFYNQRKALTTQLESFIQNSTSTLEPAKMVELGLDFLQTAFGPQQLALYLSPNLGLGPLNLAFGQGGTFPDKLSGGSLTTAADIQRFRKDHDLDQDVILPLYKGPALLGVFLFDKKSSGLGYFAEDHELLKKFAFYFVTGFYIACLSQKTLAAYQKTETARRMEVIGTLASGVAHDFNNLLSTIIMSVSLLKYLTQDTDILERLKIIQASAEKGAEITKALSDYTSTLPPEEAVSLYEIMESVESQLRATLPEGLSLTLSLPAADERILADQDQLERALLELTRNAELAMNGAGKLTIEVNSTGRMAAGGENFETDDREYVCIRIHDSGEGISESIRARIFDPFFSAWTEGRGIGLGLPIARQILKNHGGWIEFTSQEGEGSSFSVYLPLASHGSSAKPAGPQTHLSAKQTEGLILLIDDEAHLRELLSEALSIKGYRVLTASNGAQGIELFKTHQADIQLVVCDLEMPRFDGRRFITEARELAPDQAILVSSGNISKSEQKTFRQQRIQFLHKPYTLEQLIQAIEQPQLPV